MKMNRSDGNCRIASLWAAILQRGILPGDSSRISRYIMILSAIATMLLFGTTVVNAANVYVRAGANGTKNGSDWTNAYTSLPATLIRGNTYYITGGNYGSHNFSDAVSGTSFIIIKKATVSDHGGTVGWTDSYASGQAVFTKWSFSQGYYDIDGVTGGGPGSWTSGFGIRVYGGGIGGKVVTLSGTSASHLRFRHIDFEHDQGRNSHNAIEDIFYAIDANTDILIQYSYLHDVSRCQFVTRGLTNMTLEYSKIARNGDGIGDTIHREAWSGVAEKNVTIRYNIFEDISNTTFIGIVNNGGDNITDNWAIYGNVFLHTPGGTGGVSNWIQAGYNSTMTISNWKIYNNTIVGIKGTSNIYAPGTLINNVAYNNIFYLNHGNATGVSAFTHDYNFYSDNYRTEGCNPKCDLDVAAAAADAHGQNSTGNPFVDWVNGDFRLSKPTNIGITLSLPHNVDPFGTIRGLDGVWDRGAYEFSGVPGVLPKYPFDIQIK